MVVDGRHLSVSLSLYLHGPARNFNLLAPATSATISLATIAGKHDRREARFTLNSQLL